MKQRSRETETFAKCIIVAVGTDEELMKHKVHSIRYNLNSLEIDVIYDVLIQNASKRALKKLLISLTDKKEADIIILITENSIKILRKIYKATNKVINKIICDLNLKPLVSKLKGELKKEFDRSACGIRKRTLIINFSGLDETINLFLTKNIYLISQIITTFLVTDYYEMSDDNSDNSNKRKKKEQNSDDNDDNSNNDNNNDDNDDNSNNDNNNDDNDDNSNNDNDDNDDNSNNDNNNDDNNDNRVDNNNASSSMHVFYKEMKSKTLFTKIKAADFTEKNSDYNTDEVNSLADALDIIKSVIREKETYKETYKETVNASDAHGRILAEDIYSEHNVPAFTTAAKHGYAVLASDGQGIRKILRKDSEKNPNVLRSGTCMWIKTGAPIPEGATAVVPLNDVRKVNYNDSNKENNGRNIDDCEKKFDIEILITPQENDNIKPVGYDIKEGMHVLQECTRIGPAAMSILALCGREKVIVFKVPSVGILSVGDELKGPDTRPLKSKCVYNGNRKMLMSLLKEHDFNPVDYGISPYNNASSLISNIQRAIKEVKVLVILGGTNKKDIVKPVLKGHFKANMYFDRVNIKPGKSTALAKSTFENEDKYFFCMSASPSVISIIAHVLLLPFLNELRCNFSYQFPIMQSCLESKTKLHQRPQLSWAKLEWNDLDTFPRAYTPTSNIGHCYNILKYEKSNAILILPPRSQHATELFSVYVTTLLLK